MYCPYCGQDNDSKYRFCMFCAAELISEKDHPANANDERWIKSLLPEDVIEDSGDYYIPLRDE